MTTYEPLTKKIIDADGNELVVCAYYGTEKCRDIHKNECNSCPMMAAFIKQLNAFEEVYLDELQ